MNPALTAGTTLALVSGLTLAQLGFLGWWSARTHPAWTSRGIKPVRSWTFTLTVALTTAAAVYPALLLFTPVNPWEASGAALSVFLILLAACTDLASYRIPRDITLLTAAVAIPNLIAAGLNPASLVGVGFWAALIAVMFTARRFIGMGDVRLLFALTFTLAWWVSVQWMLYAFILAQGLQLALTVAAKLFHFGQQEPVRAGGKPRLHLPLAPALAGGYLTAITVTALTGINACTSLAGAVSCQRFG